MNETELKTLLTRLAAGDLDVETAYAQLRPEAEDRLECACLDHQRWHRTGRPEVVFAQGKSVAQLAEILPALLQRPLPVLATRVDADKAAAVCRQVSGLTYQAQARVLIGNEHHIQAKSTPPVALVTAGTSDIPVAEEARATLFCLGHASRPFYDLGVAGLHRLLAREEELRRAPVILVFAGMEGALPSVVAGMTPAPVIGVPTSVGYGTGQGGFAALLGMLNTCAPGLAVVNIDNGFGAACMAAAILTHTATLSAAKETAAPLN